MTAMLTALATVTPDVTDAVTTWREAVQARDQAWNVLCTLIDQHNARQAREGRRIRRGVDLTRSELRYAALEHAVIWSRGDIEHTLRQANPTADRRTIVATMREVTR